MFRLAVPPATDRRHAARRGLLRGDGAATLLAGLALLLAAGPLHDAMGWPSARTLTALGVAFLIYGASLLTFTALRPVSRGVTLAVALLNNLWFDASLVVAAVGPAGLTGTGRAVILLVGTVAMAFAVAQVLAVRQR